MFLNHQKQADTFMLCIFTTIFQTQNKQNCRNKASTWEPETFFLEEEGSTSACPLHQHSTLCPTGQSSGGGENASFDLSRAPHSLAQILDKGARMPWFWACQGTDSRFPPQARSQRMHT